MQPIVIRANGAKSLGMGHLNRCLIVAKHLLLSKGIKSLFIVNDDSSAKDFLQAKKIDFEIIYVDPNFSPEKDAKFISQIVAERSASLILLDLLEEKLTDNFLSTIKQTNKPIASIVDDSNYREVPVDLVLNGNPNQVDFKYPATKTKYLLGPNFFIMDSQYANIAEKKWHGTNRILVTLGGSDHNNLLFNLLLQLKKIESIDEIIVISSKATGYSEKLLAYAKSYPIKIRVHFDVPGIFNFWKECDLAITAGGNTLFERIASGTPGVTVCQLPRQVEIADKFMELGVNINLGFGLNLDNDNLLKNLKKFIEDKNGRTAQMAKCHSVVNGNGIVEFGNALASLIK